jgi:hypothetical protein
VRRLAAGQLVGDELAARLARYRELRDAGQFPAEAAAGAGMPKRAEVYERWYRRARGLPDRHPKWNSQ